MANASAVNHIEHVVVLMFENRSFDHVFGALPGVNGVLGPDGQVNQEYYNLPYPLEPVSEKNKPVHLSPADPNIPMPHDFNHDFGDGMMPDRFGPIFQRTTHHFNSGYVNGQPTHTISTPPPPTHPATNSGFLTTRVKDKEQGPSALSYFEHGALSVLHELATQFVVCDNWFCDMPGHTMPNREFMHCGGTGIVVPPGQQPEGGGINDTDSMPNTGPTIFDLIEQHTKKTWKMYTPMTMDGKKGQLDTRFLNSNVQYSSSTGIPISQFAQDVKTGLPLYSFIMCWQPHATEWTDTSMHPNSMMQAGENLLAAVYNALRNSPSWEKTLLVVTFDENGGMYDHVVPPATHPPNPGYIAKQSDCKGASPNPWLLNSCFDFSILGFRIPVLLISPWLARGVDHTQYQNTSVLRFLEDMISTSTPLYLTERDRKATSIAAAFSQFGLDRARTDTPDRIRTLRNSPDPKNPVPLPYGDGLLTDGPAVGPEIANRPPLPHMVEITTNYLGSLPGHADSPRVREREFATNRDLDRYAEQRERAANWFHAGEQRGAEIRIVERVAGDWVWELLDARGVTVAAPPNGYATRERAIEELDRVRFLFHELCCEP
jgi:phospholipase C